MIKTPLGNIIICIDDKPIEYKAAAYANDRICPDLNGRYFISVQCEADGKTHTVDCRIEGHIPHKNDGIDGGEDLFLINFFKGSAKLAVATAENFLCMELSDGIRVTVTPEKNNRKIVFGITWLDCCNETNEIQTWFGADPTLI